MYYNDSDKVALLQPNDYSDKHNEGENHITNHNDNNNDLFNIVDPRPTRNYRPDIDGLRAFAIILVIFYHAKIKHLHSGFIGVDVFFVISGYLITLSIIRGLESGKFTFSSYYSRRLWRLQPSALTMMLFTLIFTTILYDPTDYKEYTASLVWATALSSNTYFENLKAGYFAEKTSIMPLIHTWSLAIEWKWYIIYPLIVYLLFKTNKPYSYITGLFIISSFYSLYTQINPLPYGLSDNRYYSLTCRIFELLMGSVISSPIIVQKSLKINKCIRTILGLISFCILIFISFLKISSLYPNHYTFIVCLCTSILIIIGNTKNEQEIQCLFSRFLGWNPLNYIGKISYTLYLLHWPILCLLRSLSYHSTLYSITCSLLTFVLVMLLYYKIEKPLIKYHNIGFIKSFKYLLLYPFLFAILLHGLNLSTNGLPQRLPSDYHHIIKLDNIGSKLGYNPGIRSHKLCDEINDNTVHCKFSAEHKNMITKKVLLIGDSHAAALSWFVKKHSDVKGFDLDIKSTNACLPFPESTQNNHYSKKECQNFKQEINNLKRNQYDYVLMTSFWAHYLYGSNPDYFINNDNIKYKSDSFEYSKDVFKYSLEDSINKIIDSGAIPILIDDTYDISGSNLLHTNTVDPKYCVLNKYRLSISSESMDSCNFIDNTDKDPYRSFIKEIFNSMKFKFASLKIYDMIDVQCENKICAAEVDRYPVYNDNAGHITWYASHAWGKRTKLTKNIFN